MSSRLQLLVLLLLGVVSLCQCHAETTEGPTETSKKEPTTTEGVVVTGVVLSTTFVVLIVLLPTIAIDKYKKAKARASEPVAVQQ